MLELVFWEWLSWIKGLSLVREKPSGKIIAVDNSENSLVNIKVCSNIQILPGVVFGFVMRQWQLVSLHKDALWNTGVLNSWLDDVDSVIIKIVINDALANSEIFIWILNDWLLEVCVEFENLNSNDHISLIHVLLNSKCNRLN